MTTIIKLKYSNNNSDNSQHGASSEGGYLNDIASGVKETLININCPVGMIIDYVRELTSLDDEIDFWDDDACKLKNILSFEPTTSGLQIFQNNKIYQLVKGKHNDDEMKIEDNKNTSTSKTPKGDKKKNSNTKINLSK